MQRVRMPPGRETPSAFHRLYSQRADWLLSRADRGDTHEAMNV
jgi:hypothetical protein